MNGRDAVRVFIAIDHVRQDIERCMGHPNSSPHVLTAMAALEQAMECMRSLGIELAAKESE